MATSTFSARFAPTNSTVVTPTTFDVAATISDGTGEFSGFDVAIGNLVFLDAFGSLAAPNTVARYSVIALNSIGPVNVNVRLQWLDSGAVVDPAEVLGSLGFIATASTVNSFAWHAAPTLHNFPDYVVQYSRNKELKDTIDGQLGGGGGGEGALFSADTILSSLQILSLDSVPVMLLAAPGVGKYTAIDSVEVLMPFNTNPYTGGADLYVDYAVTPAQNLAIDAGVLLSGVTTTRWGQPVFVLPDTVPIAINEAVTISTSAPFLSGNSTLKVRLRYRTYTALT